MGSYFSKQHDQVTLVISQSRSNSTAYLIGLLHNPAVVRAFNEPYFQYVRNSLLLTGVRPVINEHNAIIAKDLIAGKTVAIEIMAGQMDSREEMNVILDYYALLCGKKLILTIRHPMNQIYSYLQRRVNDTLFGLGKDGLTKEQLDDIITGKNYHGHDAQKINQVIAQVKDESANIWVQTKKWIVKAKIKGFQVLIVNSIDLTRKPADTMKKTCEFAGLEYTDKMVDGWDDNTKKEKLVDFATENWDEEHKNAWNGPAYNSTGIHIGKNEFNVQLPAEYDYVINAAMMIYNELTAL